jgi:hypothetical protein
MGEAIIEKFRKEGFDYLNPDVGMSPKATRIYNLAKGTTTINAIPLHSEIFTSGDGQPARIGSYI